MVCKNWCHEIAMIINANKMTENAKSNDAVEVDADKGSEKSVEIVNTGPVLHDLTRDTCSESSRASAEPGGIDLTEEEPSQAIRVVPNSFLKDEKTEDVIDLSSEAADVIDLCAGRLNCSQ